MEKIKSFIKKASICFFFLITVSCKVASINSERNKLVVLESKGWTFYLNSEEIVLSKTILDKRNFSSVDVKRAEKKIFIKHKEKNLNLLSLVSTVVHDSLTDKDLIIIDGFPYSNLDARSFKMESSAIIKVNKLSDTLRPGCKPIKNLIVITTQ